MVIVPADSRLKLDPNDEYTHVPEAVSNYNESMYFNAFDTGQGIGAWMRIGNRPNEGHAEMTCCVYLPDGRVGFMFGRPAITGNDAMAAAGMRFDVVEPFKRHQVAYDGELLIMDDPHDLADPGAAFKKYPRRPASLELTFDGISPMHGGEIVTLDGQPVEVDPDRVGYRGHIEQHMAVRGRITVDGQTWDIAAGTGYRDKSWGPRHWHSFYWYKWLPLTFGPDFGLLLSIKGRAGQPDHVSGNVLTGGEFEPVVDGRIESQWGPHHYVRSLTAWVRTERREYTVEGEVLTLVPLRHRRAGGDGTSYTRITEALTRFTCEGRTALGMAEYLDVMENGVPISLADGGDRAG